MCRGRRLTVSTCLVAHIVINFFFLPFLNMYVMKVEVCEPLGLPSLFQWEKSDVAPLLYGKWIKIAISSSEWFSFVFFPLFLRVQFRYPLPLFIGLRLLSGALFFNETKCKLLPNFDHKISDDLIFSLDLLLVDGYPIRSQSI